MLHLYGSERTLQDGRTVIADEDYFRRAILDPAAELTSGYPNVMPSYDGHITPERIDALIAFYRTLSAEGGDPGP